MKGDALLQKNFTVDFLTKKLKKNEGEVPQYYVTGNHEAIIDPATFDLVQAEIERRRNVRRYSGVTIFSNKIKCGECGNFYGSKIWHSNDKYRCRIYQCNHKYEGKKCSTPHLREKEIKAAFIEAVNKLLNGKENLLENLMQVKEQICDIAELEVECQRLMEEMQMLSDMVKNHINENARIAQDQKEYQKKYDELVSRYDAAKKKYDDVSVEIQQKRTKEELLDAFSKNLKSRATLLTEFDDGLWGTIVDFMTVYGKNDFGVTFRDGTEIRVGAGT